MNFVLRPGDNAALAEIGGKALALADLRDAGLPIPPWFALSPRAFDACRASPETVGLVPAVRREVLDALLQLCPDGQAVAVRSSAVDEDGTGHSFAGQFESYLFVDPQDVPSRVLDVWRSGYSDRVLAYRREHKLEGDVRPPAVLVQRMVNAEVSGVAFGADPVSGRRGIVVIAALHGLGTALVSGECDADTFHVDRIGTIVHREVADKTRMHSADPTTRDGVATVDVPDVLVRRAALTDAQVLEVTKLVRACGSHFGRPQDIEWAIEGGQLFLLQSRPITSLNELTDPNGELQIWDNSNIAESYNGITTPLTFSFARHVYAEVYRQFCHIMRVPDETIAQHHNVYERMLGLVRGRVYYNLLNWYRLLALLPGFTYNRRFMEQMMGVREELPPEVVATLGWKANTSKQARRRDGRRLARSILGLIVNGYTLPRRIEEFYKRLNGALAAPRASLEQMRADELAAHYHDLERQLLMRWDAPLVNDFLAMIFYGVLRRLCEKWCGDEALANSLLSGGSGMISMEPAQLVGAMAQTAAQREPFVEVLCNAPLSKMREEIALFGEFRKQYQEYLDKFGDRCLEELKLESSTLHDDPSILLRSVGQLAQRQVNGGALLAAKADDTQRIEAEAVAARKIGGRWPRRRIFGWVLKQARARVRDRENLRFERTRVFGRVRQIFVELGKRLYAMDALEQPRDVFYLQVEEVLGFVEGTAVSTDLRGLVVMRRAEFDGYRSLPAPADRFSTYGTVYQGNSFQPEVADSQSVDIEDPNQRSGIGCCAGIVRGLVRVVSDPSTVELKSGEILVAERTDPGWVMLFPAASGLLVERGSLLSHSAIVAREMGLPAIVAIAGVTQWLRDGDVVEMNGATGTVRRLEAETVDAQ